MSDEKKPTKQSWKITRVQRIEAARQKIRNADWTIDDMLDYLKDATGGGDNEFDPSKYDLPPVLTRQRCRTEMTRVANDMKLTTTQKKSWDFKKGKTKAELEAERIEAENEKLKEEWLASTK